MYNNNNNSWLDSSRRSSERTSLLLQFNIQGNPIQFQLFLYHCKHHCKFNKYQWYPLHIHSPPRFILRRITSCSLVFGQRQWQRHQRHSTSQYSSSYSPDLIVPVVRSFFGKVASLPDPALDLDLDLESDGLTEGEYADWYHIQQADTYGSNQSYLPLSPYQTPILARPPEVGHARLGCTHRGTQ